MYTIDIMFFFSDVWSIIGFHILEPNTTALTRTKQIATLKARAFCIVMWIMQFSYQSH